MNRLVVISNRVPIPAGGAAPGGLAVALDGLMERRGGLWFGWSGNVSDAVDTLHVTDGPQLHYATVDLSAEEHERYYNGFSNGVMWPLLHSMPELMSYDRRDAQVYRKVNDRLTQALAPLLRPTDVLWVHDYHLMSMPAMLRARGIAAPIGFFLHVPFPSADILSSVPEAPVILRDLLHADMIGFQTGNDVENFALAAVRLVGATRIGATELEIEGRRVRLGDFPAEIEPREFAQMAQQAVRHASLERLRRSLNGQTLVLGVDRLDPTKGLLQRLAGYRRLIETRPDWRRRMTLLQIAPLSRQDVASYRALRNELDREAGRINADWGEPDWLPLRVLARGGARSTVSGYMREARVGLVTPLRDGMNLVAKEFVAAQDPADPGVLVLSRFAGAAQQLQAATIVNPHDPDEMADAIDRGLRMPLAERQERWRTLWSAIESTSPIAWGRNFLAALLRASGAAADAAEGSDEVPAPSPARAIVARAEQPIAVPPARTPRTLRPPTPAETKPRNLM